MAVTTTTFQATHAVLRAALFGALELDGFTVDPDPWCGDKVTSPSGDRKWVVFIRPDEDRARDVTYTIRPVNGDTPHGDDTILDMFTANTIPATVRLLHMLDNEAGF
jgi:hypothetical protein